MCICGIPISRNQSYRFNKKSAKSQLVLAKHRNMCTKVHIKVKGTTAGRRHKIRNIKEARHVHPQYFKSMLRLLE